jgi:SAM-dependent methyltransferase
VDLVTAGQALHWFDLRKARAEFKRILREGGFVAIVYNHRKKRGRLELAYERLVDRHRRNAPPTPDINEAYVSKFLGDKKLDRLVVQNSQTLDLDGILGRLASASYMPTMGSQGWAELEKDARRVVREYGRNGTVKLRYDTTMYLGRIVPDTGT